MKSTLSKSSELQVRFDARARSSARKALIYGSIWFSSHRGSTECSGAASASTRLNLYYVYIIFGLRITRIILLDQKLCVSMTHSIFYISIVNIIFARDLVSDGVVVPARYTFFVFCIGLY